MKILQTLSIVFFLVLGFFIVQAQNGQQTVAEEALRQDNKIYVVVLVLLTVMAGIIFLLTTLEKRIKKIESKSK